MNRDMFEKLLDELDGNSINTLKEKNAKYSSPDDCLHNFNAGGDIFGGTAAEACWGYLTKHLVALRDMVKRNDFSNRADFLEKCQDSINYIRFLWCIGNEGVDDVPNPEFDKYIRKGKSETYMFVDFPDVTACRIFINEVENIFKTKGVITLADFYTLMLVPASYVDEQIIWSNIDDMSYTLGLKGICILSIPMPDKFNKKGE